MLSLGNPFQYLSSIDFSGDLFALSFHDVTWKWWSGSRIRETRLGELLWWMTAQGSGREGRSTDEPFFRGMKDQLPTVHNLLNLIKNNHTNWQMLTMYLESSRNEYCCEYKTFYLCLEATVWKALKTLLSGQKAVWRTRWMLSRWMVTPENERRTGGRMVAEEAIWLTAQQCGRRPANTAQIPIPRQSL